MEKSRNSTAVRVLAAAAYLLMILVNALANILPINGVTTGEVSDAYPNLFTPAAITFAIWGLIYLLLAGYIVYQLGWIKAGTRTDEAMLDRIGVYFIISSLANAAWIIAWHYYKIPLSVLFMLVILVCLILISRIIAKAGLTGADKLFVTIPFGIYFGWITVATIANITVLLVSLGWDGLGIPEPVWMVVISLVGAVIGSAVILKNRCVAYALAMLWAYFGILLKQTSANGFAGAYPGVITAVIISMALLLASGVYVLLTDKK